MNQFEFDALAADGLPHECQLLYMRVLRRFMDYKTGVVGLTRRLSYQGLREVLEVQRPQRSKVPSQVYTQRQVRWFLERLELVGLIKRQPEPLVFLCCLATTDLFCPNEQRHHNVTTTADTATHMDSSKAQLYKGVGDNRHSNSGGSESGNINIQRHTSVNPSNSLSNLNTRKKFSMHSEWLPVDERKVAEYLLSFGVDVMECSDWQKGAVLEQFVSYWANERPNAIYTQAVWEDKFSESALRVLRGKVN